MRKELGLRKLGINIGAMMISQAAMIILSLFLSIMLARGLGRTGNGVYTLAQLLPTILSTLLNLGISSSNSYFLGSGQVSAKAALRASINLSLILSVVGILIGVPVIIFAGDKLFHGVDKPYLWWMMAIFPISLLQLSLVSIFTGIQKFRPYNVIVVATSVANVLLLALFIYGFKMKVVGALSAYGFAQFGTLILTWLWLRPYIPHVENSAEEAKDYTPKCLSYGYKAHLSNILGFLNYRIDVFLVGFFLGPAPVGIYAVAILMAERLWILSYAASWVTLPRLSELNKDESAQRMLTPIVGRWVLMLTFAFSLLVLAVGRPVLNVLYGAQYSYAYTLILWLLPGVIFCALSRVLANDIAARGKVQINLYMGILIFAVNLIACLILIPRYGLPGGAAATSLGYLFDTILRVIIYTKISGNNWWGSLVPHKSDLILLGEARKAITEKIRRKRPVAAPRGT